MPRDIDHVVIAVKDLEVACASWRRLGFVVSSTTTPIAGAASAFVQLDGSYVELFAVADSTALPDADNQAFSPAGFNRAFLDQHSGLSTLVLQSSDPAADRAEFEADELDTAGPFDIDEAVAAPNGIDRHLSLIFARERRLREAAFAICRHNRPEAFWRSDLQQHRNGAQCLVSAVLVTRDPADFHEFLSKFSGQHDMVSTSVGVTFHLGRSAIEVLSPTAFNAFFGEISDADPRRFLGLRIGVRDLPAVRQLLNDSGIDASEHFNTLVVPSSATGGVALAFVDQSTFLL